MNYNNYSKSNKNSRQNHTIREPIDKTAPIKEHIEPTICESIDKKVPTKEHVEHKFVEGVVTDCIALNIRNRPSIDADVIHIADAGCRVTIELEHSTDEWYRVVKIFNEEVYGFCMKKFIKLE